MKRYVYLAGPITGMTEGEAKDWRKYVSSKLGKHIIGVSPLRTEPLLGPVYDAEKQAHDIKYGTPKAITAKNKLDVAMSDFVLAYMPTESIGTFIELGWADDQNKPICVVTQNPKIKIHPVVNGVAPWILPTLDDAIDIIKGTFDVYAD